MTVQDYLEKYADVWESTQLKGVSFKNMAIEKGLSEIRIYKIISEYEYTLLLRSKFGGKIDKITANILNKKGFDNLEQAKKHGRALLDIHRIGIKRYLEIKNL